MLLLPDEHVRAPHNGVRPTTNSSTLPAGCIASRCSTNRPSNSARPWMSPTTATGPSTAKVSTRRHGPPHPDRRPPIPLRAMIALR
jgi:hypothetical protein